MAGPNYTYTPNIPQATQTRASSQAPLLSNFQAIPELIQVNHVGFNNPADYGKHNFTTFPVQGSAPTTSATEMAVYCAAGTGVNPYELFYRYPSDGTIVQLTGSTTADGVSANGFARIAPIGATESIVVKWGTATGIVPGDNLVLFPTGAGIPIPSSSRTSMLWTWKDTTLSPVSGTIKGTTTSTGFTFYSGSGYSTPRSIYYLQIGLCEG